MEFRVTTSIEGYRSILEKRIVDCLCKHVMNLDTESGVAKEVYDSCVAIGYNNVMWGYSQPFIQGYEDNRLYQIHHIYDMERYGYGKAVRLVIDMSGEVWVDNLHSAIKFMFSRGADLKLGDLPCYIVDMRCEIPVVVDVSGVLSDSVSDIRGAVGRADKRCSCIFAGCYELGYTIGDFLVDNDMLGLCNSLA